MQLLMSPDWSIPNLLSYLSAVLTAIAFLLVVLVTGKKKPKKPHENSHHHHRLVHQFNSLDRIQRSRLEAMERMEAQLKTQNHHRDWEDNLQEIEDERDTCFHPRVLHHHH
uniref:Uncharacterized protein n=1 Tax=Schistocephalus solidus TaxID=70667 RepID=A0A0X3Q6H3_SCHSO